MTNWISVEDKLPNVGDWVLLYDSMFETIDLFIINFDPKDLDADYSHWMPLPKPPDDD